MAHFGTCQASLRRFFAVEAGGRSSFPYPIPAAVRGPLLGRSCLQTQHLKPASVDTSALHPVLINGARPKHGLCSLLTCPACEALYETVMMSGSRWQGTAAKYQCKRMEAYGMRRLGIKSAPLGVWPPGNGLSEASLVDAIIYFHDKSWR